MSLSLQLTGQRTTPVVLQTEAAECGLACLAMVATYHGYRTDLATLRRTYPMSLKGATLGDLIQVAAQLNLAARPLKVELERLEELALPAVLHWDFNHFVVLTRVTRDAVVVHDPARGERRIKLDDVSKHFTGVVLELARAPHFEPRTERRRVSLRALVGPLQGARTIIAQVLLLALVLEVFAVAGPLFLQLVVDEAITPQDRSFLTVLAIGFLLLGVIQGCVTALRSWTVTVLSTAINLQLVNNLFRHLLSLPLAFFEKRHLGDLASRFDSLRSIETTLTTTFAEAVIDGLMATATFGAMWLYSARLSAMVLGAAAAYAALRWALLRSVRQAQHEEIVHSARQQTSFLETVRGIQSVKLFNRQLQRLVLHQNLLTERLNAAIRVQRLTIVQQWASGTLFAIENVFVIGFGASLALDGRLSVGMLFAFVAYKQLFGARVKALIEKLADFGILGLHTERVADIALCEPEPEGGSGGERWRSLEPQIELRHVSFRYSAYEPAVLEDVSLTVARGEFVAIVGPSGCGKTTLLKLILGLLPPTTGQILVGGIDVAHLGPGYRNLIGTVMQEDQLFAGSLADNICFFDAEPDQQRMENCAHLAAIDAEIRALPMGYNTLVGDMGTVLSGGQRQRVLLARALYRQPRILCLDEATSHLDAACERRVNEAIRSLNLTRIVVAHRTETIQMASRTIALQGAGEHALRGIASAA
jgi:ATP-binding cassette subfamily B protein RaxB